MEAIRRKVLVIDDDPLHLEIYGLLVKEAGFEPLPTIVRFSGPEFPEDKDVSLVLLDYRLNSVQTAPEIAQEVQRRYAGAPIVVLSDLWSMPSDVTPYVAHFIRKGEPAKLISMLRDVLMGLDAKKA